MKLGSLFCLVLGVLMATGVRAEEASPDLAKEKTAASGAEATVVSVSVDAEPAKKAAEEAPAESVKPVVYAQKTLNLTGLVSGGKLNESVGVETLSKIVTPILKRGDSVPAKVSIKLGGIKSCDGCAKIKIYCLGQADVPKPMEVGFLAIQGFTKIDPKKPVVDLQIEMTEQSKLVLTAIPLQHPDELTFINADKLPPVKEKTTVKKVKAEKHSQKEAGGKAVEKEVPEEVSVKKDGV